MSLSNLKFLVSLSLRRPPRTHRTPQRTWKVTIRKRNYASGAIHRQVSTLDESRLLDSDFWDISNLCTPRYRLSSDIREFQYLKYSRESHQTVPFPPGTGGFLYFHSPPQTPPMAGDVRFRITSDRDPKTFASGTDLLLARGDPWTVSLLSLCGRPTYAPLASHLLRDGLITQDLFDLCVTVTNSQPKCRPERSSRIVHSLEQEFHVNFGTNCLALWVVGKYTIGYVRIRMPTERSSTSTTADSLYMGGGLCRFERALEPNHATGRTLVLRLLKITQPVAYASAGNIKRPPLPAEGQLVSKRDGTPRLWDVDRPSHHALRLLLRDA